MFCTLAKAVLANMVTEWVWCVAWRKGVHGERGRSPSRGQLQWWWRLIATFFSQLVVKG